MRYWWVNQNQTYEQEIGGGYLWSPKRNKDNSRNQYYENMREVAPGDIILSFKGKRIRSIGFAESYCYECPKPTEFGKIGGNWNVIGWKVDVRYIPAPIAIQPSEHMSVIAPLLPKKYSPLLPSGKGMQSVYLAQVPTPLAEVLLGLIGFKTADTHLPIAADGVLLTNRRGVDEWEDHIQHEIVENPEIPSTEKAALIKARRGQGLYKEALMRIEDHCRITKVSNPIHLVGSHIKPWRDSENHERLDGENGLLLTPSIDHLFDRGLISFENSGELLISPRADKESLAKMGVPTNSTFNAGPFHQGQKHYLEFHRNLIFLQVRT